MIPSDESSGRVSAQSLSEHNLRQLLTDRFAIDGSSLTLDQPLFSSGTLDSFHLLDLMAYLESTARIRISPGEVSLDNLDSMARILAFVHRKQHSSPTP